MIGLLFLINGFDITILWAGLAKHSEEISCSQNLVAARDLCDARRTFCASSYENLMEKSARHASGVSWQVKMHAMTTMFCDIAVSGYHLVGGLETPTIYLSVLRFQSFVAYFTSIFKPASVCISNED